MPRHSCFAALLIACLAASPAHAYGPLQGQPPNDPRCLPLGAGTTGIIYAGGLVPAPDQLLGRPGGFGPVVAPRLARSLPDRVVFRTGWQTFSNDYAFVVRDRRIYVRRAKRGIGIAGEPWHLLELPSCLDREVRQISADHNLLIALGPDRQVYSNDMPGGDISPERWTWRWGPYFWTASGYRLPDDVRDWAASEFTSGETFTDSAGHSHHPIGVATVYLLRGGGRRITYIDPWLPNDESRQVCAPRRGTTRVVGLSGSGSVVFAASSSGELFTRLYDFDVAGANTVFGDYSWRRQRPESDPRWQLPGPGWVRQPAPPGSITDLVSISKSGDDAAERTLRVEGLGARGQAGYWQKQLGEAGGGAWRFVPTGGELEGKILPRRNAHDVKNQPADRLYLGEINGAGVAIQNFNAECSPARMVVRLGGKPLRLLLHSSDGLRQETRPPGLDESPREYNGAIEIPPPIYRVLDQASHRVREWVGQTLSPGRFTTAPIAVTRTRVRFLAQCWQLTFEGRPARRDRERIPPDIGADVGRFTEAQKDGRGLPAC